MFKIKKNKDFKETKVLKLDSAKAYEKLKWKTILDLNELSFYISEWYKAFYTNKRNCLKSHLIKSVDMKKTFK